MSTHRGIFAVPAHCLRPGESIRGFRVVLFSQYGSSPGSVHSVAWWSGDVVLESGKTPPGCSGGLDW